MKRLMSTAAITLAGAVVLAGCSGGGPSTVPSNSAQDDTFTYDSGNCQTFDVASSPEKVAMMDDFAQEFKKRSEQRSPDNCYAPIVTKVSSGDAATYLEDNWEGVNLPRPAMWSPASSVWVDYVAEGTNGMIDEWQSFAHTPVVLAMPEQMAKQLGWPGKAIGFNDIHDVCLGGWGTFGGAAATWGDFKLAKTNPTSSTTGLNMVLMQAYAANKKSDGLTTKDIASSSKFSKDIESCVTHYGDTTGAVLQRIADISNGDGDALTYVSAVAVEEKSIIDYNMGNPDGDPDLDPSKYVVPEEKLVAVYPKEGSLESDNPVVVLGKGADWVTPEQRAGAEAFAEYLQTDAVQSKLDEYGFRPLDNSKPLAGLFNAKYGVDAKHPATYLEKPAADVAYAAITQWQKDRKPSSIVYLMDGSGSMNNIPSGATSSYLQGAKDAAIAAIDLLRPTDRLGINVFWDTEMAAVRELKPIAGDIESNKLPNTINGIAAGGETPLYDSVWATYQSVKAQAEPGRINAIVLLSDGGNTVSNIRSMTVLTNMITADIGENANRAGQVMIFPVIYGNSAPEEELKQLAAATGGQVINATDPTLIKDKMLNAFRNF